MTTHHFNVRSLRDLEAIEAFLTRGTPLPEQAPEGASIEEHAVAALRGKYSDELRRTYGKATTSVKDAEVVAYLIRNGKGSEIAEGLEYERLERLKPRSTPAAGPCKFCGGDHETPTTEVMEEVSKRIADLRRSLPRSFDIGPFTSERIRDLLERLPKRHPFATHPKVDVAAPPSPVTATPAPDSKAGAPADGKVDKVSESGAPATTYATPPGDLQDGKCATQAAPPPEQIRSVLKKLGISGVERDGEGPWRIAHGPLDMDFWKEIAAVRMPSEDKAPSSPAQDCGAPPSHIPAPKPHITGWTFPFDDERGERIGRPLALVPEVYRSPSGPHGTLFNFGDLEHRVQKETLLICFDWDRDGIVDPAVAQEFGADVEATILMRAAALSSTRPETLTRRDELAALRRIAVDYAMGRLGMLYPKYVDFEYEALLAGVDDDLDLLYGVAAE